MRYTVNIPCYNSEKFLDKTIEVLIEEMDLIALNDYEVILVNDGSKDNTFKVIKNLSKEYKQIKGIDLARNVGQHNAILAGLREGSGEIFINLDDDLQCNPKDIKNLLNKMEEANADVVYARFLNKKYTHFKKLTSKVHNFVINWLLDKNENWVASGFWVAKSFVVEKITSYKSDYTDMQSNFIKTTKYIVNEDVIHCDRIDGASGYTFSKSFKLWISVLNYSEKLAMFLMQLGVGIFFSFNFIGILLGLFKISSFTFSMFLLNTVLSAILFCTGFLSMQLGRILRVVAEVPFVTIRERVGLNREEEN